MVRGSANPLVGRQAVYRQVDMSHTHKKLLPPLIEFCDFEATLLTLSYRTDGPEMPGLYLCYKGRGPTARHS